MKRIFRVLTLLGCIVVGIAVAGNARAYVFDMGSGSMIDISGTTNALKLDVVQMNPDLDNLSFDLAVGHTSAPIYFATIGTTETWINRDDRRSASVTAIVDFDSPDLTRNIEGQSEGFSALWHFVQGWNLEWADPVRIVMASGLDFSVDLSNVNYMSWFWRGPDGTADIYATVTLNAFNPVPIPAPLLLLATGLIGLVSIRRRINR